MGWKGMLIGSYLGGYYGRLPGSIIGAFVGHYIEERFFGRRRRASRRMSGFRDSPGSYVDPLSEAYALIGASASDSADILKRKYRDLAKKNHPDALRAQGLSEELVRKATERMSRINVAWATIRNARGI